jgi:hypothetical protein
MATSDSKARIRLWLDYQSMEITETQADEIARRTGLSPIDEEGWGGWLGSLNEQIEAFLHAHFREQEISPSAAKQRFSRIAARTQDLLDALPIIKLGENHADGSLDDFIIDALLSARKEGCEDLQPLIEKLEGLRNAAEAAVNRMKSRIADTGMPRHQGQAAFNEFLNQLLHIYVGLFAEPARLSCNSPLSGKASEPAGPLLRFVRAVLETIQVNLTPAAKESDPKLINTLSLADKALFARLRRVIAKDE